MLDVVAEGGDDERVGVRDPAAEEDQQVERGLVGPVHVFEHDDDRAARGCQEIEERGEDPVARQLGGEDVGERRCGTADVVNGIEWARGAHRVVAAAQDRGARGLPAAQFVDEHALADAGFPGQRRERAASAGGRAEVSSSASSSASRSSSSMAGCYCAVCTVTR
jgi:hypothetical protein